MTAHGGPAFGSPLGRRPCPVPSVSLVQQSQYCLQNLSRRRLDVNTDTQGELKCLIYIAVHHNRKFPRGSRSRTALMRCTKSVAVRMAETWKIGLRPKANCETRTRPFPYLHHRTTDLATLLCPVHDANRRHALSLKTRIHPVHRATRITERISSFFTRTGVTEHL